MKQSHFTETQIITILMQADAGMVMKDICRKAGISEPMYYSWKSKYDGMEASDLKRTKELEAELSQLKRMYADLALESRAMKDLIAKNYRAGRQAHRSTARRSRHVAHLGAADPRLRASAAEVNRSVCRTSITSPTP